MDDDKLREVLTVLVEELGILKTNVKDVADRQTQHTANIRDLSSGLAATRQALDPEALGQHVSKNIDQMIGEQVENLVRAVQINHDAARQSAELAAKLHDATVKTETANNSLRNIASRIEAHAKRSKWDWAVLAAGMIVAAVLAGGGAVYFTKQNLDTANFQDAIQLIRNDDQAFWCKSAEASIVQDAGGKPFCAVQMPKYQIKEESKE